MTWDATAQEVTLRALGLVESSLNYGACSATDAITVGIIQWFGGRAANILNIMMTTNPTDWVGVPSSLTTDLGAHAPSDTDFWNNRYLTKAEIFALNNVMVTIGNVTIQDTQAYADIDGYTTVGATLGLDRNANTETVSFYCNIYNRDPSSANRIVGNCGPTSNLARILAFTINDSVEGRYKTRYTNAYNSILAQDVTGIGVAGAPTPPPPPGGDGPGGSRPMGNANYIREVGSQLHLFNRDNTTLTFHRTATGIWLSTLDNNAGMTPPPNGGGTPPPTAIADIEAWLISVENTFAYSQGPGRLNPPVSGYTDCSGLLYYAFLTFANLDIGDYTGTQYKHGTLVTIDPTVAKDGVTVREGDRTLFRWSNRALGSDPFDHTSFKIAGDFQQSHGGPDAGPDIEPYSTNIDNAISGGGAIMVRRDIP